jgi:hypothetical protein
MLWHVWRASNQDLCLLQRIFILGNCAGGGQASSNAYAKQQTLGSTLRLVFQAAAAALYALVG